MQHTTGNRMRNPWNSAENLNVLFDDVRFVSPSEPLGAESDGKTHYEFSGPQWYVEMGSDRPAFASADPEHVQRVETSGLIYLRDVRDRIKDQHVSAIRRERSQTPVLLPATLPAAQAIPAARTPSWLLPSLASALIAATTSALLIMFWPRTPERGTAAVRSASTVQPEPVASNVPDLYPAELAEAVPVRAFESRYAVPSTPDTEAILAAATPVADLFKDQAANARPSRSTRSRRSGSENIEKVRADFETKHAVLAVSGQKPSAKADPPAPAWLRPETAAPRRPVPRPQPRTVAAVVPEVARPSPASNKPEPRILPETLLKGAYVRKPVAATAPAKVLPKKLSQEQIAKKLSRIRRRVQMCLTRFGYYSQSMRIRIVVRGATGRVGTAKALGRFAGTPVGTCAEIAARKLRLPVFSDTTQTFVLSLVAPPR